MLKLVVIDRSAESRSAIMARINHYLRSEVNNVALLPQVSLKPLSPEEVRFHAAPDILIVGSELARSDLNEIHAIRKLLAQTAIVVELEDSSLSLALVEQLARIGIDDTISQNCQPHEFLRKLILLSRRTQKPKSGKLILVDSGKGGVGVTSIAAGLGEALVAAGKRTLLVDMDYESQDLSRFLQARPFINENLQLMLNQARPVTQEHVEECLVQIWREVSSFFCLPPGLECDELYDPRGGYPRTLLGVLEILDSVFDCVVVDAAGCRGVMLKALYRVADKVVFIVNNDPATLYASVDKLSRMRSVLDPTADLMIVENSVDRSGLSNRILREEFSRAARVNTSHWFPGTIPFCKYGCRWPGSNSTPYSAGKDALVKAFDQIAVALGLAQERAGILSKSKSTEAAQSPERSFVIAPAPSNQISVSQLYPSAVAPLAGEPLSRAQLLGEASDNQKLQIEDQGIRFTRRSSAATGEPRVSAATSSEGFSSTKPSVVGVEVVSAGVSQDELGIDELISGARVS